jgi:rubrerythrin
MMGQFTERTTREVMNFIDDRVHNMSDAERKDIYVSVASKCHDQSWEIQKAEASDMCPACGIPLIKAGSALACPSCGAVKP